MPKKSAKSSMSKLIKGKGPGKPKGITGKTSPSAGIASTKKKSGRKRTA